MSDKTVFTEEQTRRLILAYMYGRKGEEVPTDDIAAFLAACRSAVYQAEMVRMAADGLLLVEWSKESGDFAFGLTGTGEARAKELEAA